MFDSGPPKVIHIPSTGCGLSCPQPNRRTPQKPPLTRAFACSEISTTLLVWSPLKPLKRLRGRSRGLSRDRGNLPNLASPQVIHRFSRTSVRPWLAGRPNICSCPAASSARSACCRERLLTGASTRALGRVLTLASAVATLASTSVGRGSYGRRHSRPRGAMDRGHSGAIREHSGAIPASAVRIAGNVRGACEIRSRNTTAT